MSKYVENLKAELEETSELHPTITVKRSDLEGLLREYETLKEKEEEK